MPSRVEVLGNRSICREKTLGLAGRFELLHATLPLARRPMRLLTSIMEIATLAMFHPGQQLAFGCPVALQLIRDDRGTYIKPLSNLRKNFFAAFLGSYANGIKLSSNTLLYQDFACLSAWSGLPRASWGQYVTAWDSIYFDRAARRSTLEGICLTIDKKRTFD